VDEDRRPGFATRAVHGAQMPPIDQDTPSVPIFQASTFRFESSERYADTISFRRPGFTYTRGYGNPTLTAFETLMADLEQTEAAFSFASGMAAIHTLVTTLARSGERIVASPELYGGTYSLFRNVLPRYGIAVTFVDPHDHGAVASALPGARLFYCETIANPNVNVVDLQALAELCEETGVPAAVDNTFASPYLCNPARYGFDFVVHSATKYIGGHNDLIAGVVCCSERDASRLRDTVIETGATMAPLEAWLCIRGLATLQLRMERHCSNAFALATFLEQQPKVEHVHHPGLRSHPQHALARRQLPRGFGGMLSFEVEGGVEAAERFCDALELAWIAASLGGTQTLVGHAASTTHRQLDAEARRAAGIADGLIRVSVGIEDPDDIVADFASALEKA
jgi:cystathionine beta-lyase/cystathionine gamma-synthase